MAAEVAVGEGAEIFEIIEDQAIGMGDEGGEDAEAGFFVDDAFEAVLSDAAGGFGFGVRHVFAPGSSTKWRR
jgi:hypothetical protein